MPDMDARDAAEPILLGSPLRDAAVDPKPWDFLPPTNAGEADPHGPLVVSPEIHGTDHGGIRPGDVHVDDTDEQGRQETAMAEDVFVDQVPVPEATATAARANDAVPEGVPGKAAGKSAGTA